MTDFTEQEISWAMEAHEKKIPQNKFNERQKEVYEIFISHFNNNQHKMQPIPVCKIPFDFI